AMAATRTVGISRLVLSRRERAVMLEPCGKGIVLWTLRYGDEVRDPDEVFAGLEDKTAESRLVSLVATLIGDLTKPWSRDLVRDPVQEKLKDLIEAKRKKDKRPASRKKKKEEEPEVPGNVVSIMDALKKSLS